MTKVSQRVENIFARASAIEQRGGFKSIIYVEGREIYMLNGDSTFLVRIRLRASETPFQSPISFRVDDYDSRKFYEEDGQIVFEAEESGWTKKTHCRLPDSPSGTPKELFAQYKPIAENQLTLTSGLLVHLQENLSHIEISARENEACLVQRNVYNGSRSFITRSQDGGFNLDTDYMKEDFGPVGLRTKDFIALFDFYENLIFGFATEPIGYCWVSSGDRKKMDMCAILACCQYDELGTTFEEDDDGGRKKQKTRRHQQEADRPAEKSSAKRKSRRTR